MQHVCADMLIFFQLQLVNIVGFTLSWRVRERLFFFTCNSLDVKKIKIKNSIAFLKIKGKMWMFGICEVGAFPKNKPFAPWVKVAACGIPTL